MIDDLDERFGIKPWVIYGLYAEMALIIPFLLSSSLSVFDRTIDAKQLTLNLFAALSVAVSVPVSLYIVRFFARAVWFLMRATHAEVHHQIFVRKTKSEPFIVPHPVPQRAANLMNEAMDTENRKMIDKIKVYLGKKRIPNERVHVNGSSVTIDWTCGELLKQKIAMRLGRPLQVTVSYETDMGGL